MKTRNRFSDALAIQQGASNGSGVARALVEAMDEARREHRGTKAMNEDPAVQLIVHQLAWLARLPTGWDDWDDAMQHCAERCNSYRDLLMFGYAERVKLFSCDYDGL